MQPPFDCQKWHVVSLCVFVISLLFSPVSWASFHTIRTSCGTIKGRAVNGAYSFRGIPYAKPPIGRLRWRAPEPAECWKGTLDATQFGSPCYQRKLSKIYEHSGSEDCLFMNVWTPSPTIGANLPVIVWVHGGFNQFMHGNIPGYSPAEGLARDTGVVYVSMNFRLHAFGFMSLDVLSRSSPTKTSGNYGLLDIILSLEWVRDNIELFGGDPNKVTVFGQGSGATNIYALLASRLASGLFYRAWISSAAPLITKTAAQAAKDNTVFLNNTGCYDITCLRNLDARTITMSVPWYEFPNWSFEKQLDLPDLDESQGAMLIVDGHVLKESPLDSWAMRRRIDIPLVIGSTAQEIDLYPASLDVNYWTKSHYENHLLKKLVPFGGEVYKTALMFYSDQEKTIQNQFTTMVSDVRVTCPTDMMAMMAALNFRAPVYRYVVTTSLSKPSGGLGYGFKTSSAFHTIDAMGFFHSLKYSMPSFSQSDDEFQKTIQEALLQFAKEGKPPECWRPFPQNTILIGTRTQLTSAYHARECQFWSNSGLVQYGWKN